MRKDAATVDWLEVEPQTELHAAWRVRARQMQEVRAVKVRSGISSIHCDTVGTLSLVVDLIELGVVKQVKALPLEFESCSFVDGKPLERTKVEIQAAWIVQRISPDVAKREARGQRERRWVVNDWPADVREFGLGDACVRIADQIRTGTRAHAIAYTGVVAKGGAVRYGKRQA